MGDAERTTVVVVEEEEEKEDDGLVEVVVKVVSFVPFVIDDDDKKDDLPNFCPLFSLEVTDRGLVFFVITVLSMVLYLLFVL